ncbi:MAG: hypothetical protein Q9M91_00310 [Candidatus Dojkabacteria bacterium]|nr:hypothetical protein [Candidatus Dojkabacteria bacterium]MDQ7020274.1 hypothetical protein [Candidatus Dojkabacteria bacterium]
MKFSILTKNIISKEKKGEAITSSTYPKDTYLDSEIIKKLKDIERFTNNEGFLTKKSGAVGWEYAVSLYFLIDKIYISKPISGNYSSVNVGGGARVHPIYSQDNSNVKFELEIGDLKQITKNYKTKDLGSEIRFGKAATFHTHPKFYHDENTYQYGFFSHADISSLLYGNSSVLGLIAGNNLWLACKTNDSRMIPNELLSEASRQEVISGVESMKNFVSSNLNEYGIIFFFGSFGGKLKRV